MNRRLRVSAVMASAALAATLLASPTASFAVSRLPATASTSGFLPVATIPFTVTSVASPAEGVAYVAGTDADGAVRLTRVTSDGTTTEIPVPAASTTAPTLTTAGGTTWLLAEELYTLEGTTLTRVAMPTPASMSGARISAISADGPNSLWVAVDGLTHDAELDMDVRTVAALHWDGSAWTQTSTPTWGARTVPWSYADGGRFYVNLVLPVHFGSYSGMVTDGSTWADSTQGGPTRTEWTFASPTDYTMWGSVYSPLGTAAQRGTCTHVVDGTVVPDCVAPDMMVTEAARLADGRVILGGTTADPAAAPGRFMLVEHDGATPQDFPGDIGNEVVELAAETTGSHVWAATLSEGVYSLQRADAGSTEAAPPATPAPTTTSPPAPTPSTDTTTPAPKKTRAPKPTRTPRPAPTS